MSARGSSSAPATTSRPCAASPPRRLALPTLLLLLALATLLLYGGDRGHFYRGLQHNQQSSHHLVLAANTSVRDNFLGFYYRTLDADGNPAYGGLYNRFPFGARLLTKLAILPFQDDLSAQIHAARLLMLAFFAGAVALAYLSLCRLTSVRWVALAATCLSFSSFYCLYNSDFIITEGYPDLFGVLLAFHGMVVFVQEGRFRQLLVKSCLPLLIGWHIFALLLPFVLLGLATGLHGMRRAAAPPAAFAAPANIHKRCLLLGGSTLLLGLAVLGANFGNEYVALNAQAATDLPSFQSMLRRLGLGDHATEHWAELVAWQPYLTWQLFRIGSMFIPYCLAGIAEWMAPSGWQAALGGFVGAGLLLACLAGLASLRWRMLWATLALSGPCWSLPMRHQVVAHPFESIFYVGLPLLFFTLVLLIAYRRFGARVVVGLAVMALSVFVLSGAQMAQRDNDAETAKLHRNLLADLQRMRGDIVGKVVIVPPSWAASPTLNTAIFYLAGSTVLFGTDSAGRTRADFVITPERADDAPTLTPENRLLFLYGRAAHGNRKSIATRAGGALLRNEHGAVYLHDHALYFERPVSARISRRTPVVGDPFRARLNAPLGDHALAKSWQWQASRDGQHWVDVVGRSTRRREYVPTAADVGHRLRARIGYLDSSGEWAQAVSGPSLPVLARDAGPGPRFRQSRVFLHVVPVDADDLGEDHRQGFERLDFRFDWQAIPYQASGMAMAMRRLPDYPIAAIRVGETIAGEGVLWSAEIGRRELEALK